MLLPGGTTRQDRPARAVPLTMEPLPPARGPAAVADALTRSGAFVECVFHCPACGAAGTSLVRPAVLPGKTCAFCAEPVVVSVLERFARDPGR
jgi:hypothetical protein